MSRPCLAAVMRPLARFALPVVLFALSPRSDAQEEREREAPRPGENLVKEIEELAEGKQTESASIRVDWLREGQMTTAVIHGRGVGIWKGSSQFRLPAAEVLSLFRALKTAGFGAMPESFGESEDDVLRIRGKLAVRVGDKRKTVVQILSGKESQELKELAEKVLGLAEPAARGGVSAASLNDGLVKLAAGSLAPEALELVVHRRPETADPKASGFLLRVEGREAVVRPFQVKAGYGTPKRLILSAPELLHLIETLRGAGLDALPQNLYAPEYTDLRVQVLDRVKDLQARRWLDVTPGTHGEKQKAFDRLYEEARRLAERVLAKGADAPGAG